MWMWGHVDVGTDPELPEILLLLLLNSVNSLILTDRCVGKCMGTGPRFIDSPRLSEWGHGDRP